MDNDKVKQYWDYVLSLKIKSSATLLKGPRLTYEEIKTALNGRR
jgi:hypothetical protein